jgi:hypothetical protein
MPNEVEFVRYVFKLGAEPLPHIEIFKHQFPWTDFIVQIIKCDVDAVPLQKLFKVDKLVIGLYIIIIIHIKHFLGQITSCMVTLDLSLDSLGFVLVGFLLGVEDQFVHLVTVVVVDVVDFGRTLFVEPVEPLQFFGLADAAFFLFFVQVASFFYQ